MKDFPKAYESNNVEKKWYNSWLKTKKFSANTNSEKPAFSIFLPPPNVTGILHFGHVLNITIQDLYIRRKRMEGYEVCWLPGTDHAGIATQSKVENLLKEQGLTKYDLGREQFIKKVWEWRDKYGGIILRQMHELGASCDWDRTLFTMDDAPSNAVREVFVKLFDEGLVYRGKRIINWSPAAQSAISDEEVDFKEVKEHLYTLRYYFEDSDEYLSVATVRTETIFGDIAVAVNPNDERYKDKIGKKVRVPLVNRLVEVIADEHADPEFGTGCVKITPAHDPNDFEVGIRHNLEVINTINPDGTLNENASDYAGMDRFRARKAISKKLEELQLIEKKEDYAHNVGFSQRGGEQIEPYLSDQWFVSMKPLAEIALKPVLNGEIKFHPEHWVKTYTHWMENIKDWCISRQLWWGHQIPVYYAEDGRFTAANNEKEAREKLGLNDNTAIRQDEDVLDTWFSSWLWPMTTLGWQGEEKGMETPEMKKFLPSDLLVTAPDIIFFWVARMIMANQKFNAQIPFKDVYFTSLIRDGKGRKLSKSLGNSPDPLNIIEKYGADAIRFTIIYLAPLGQDVRMDVDIKSQDIPSIEIGRNFANKIWNSGRFLAMKADQLANYQFKENSLSDLNIKDLTVADKWILSRLNTTIKNTNKALNEFKVTDYAKMMYDFIWRDYCSWYIEILKVQFDISNDEEYKNSLINLGVGIYEAILKLLHPVMPFITDEIWHLLTAYSEEISINDQPLPVDNEYFINKVIENDFEITQLIIEEIRKLRASVNIPPSKDTPLIFNKVSNKYLEILEKQKEIIASLAKCSIIQFANLDEKPTSTLASVVREIELYVQVGDAIDLDQERDRLQKEIKRLEGNIFGVSKKLSNSKFLENAKKEIIEKEKEKLSSMQESLKKVRENLANLV